ASRLRAVTYSSFGLDVAGITRPELLPALAPMISQETLSSFLSGPSLLAVAALLAYWLGRRRFPASARHRADNRHEILRALAVAQELEAIAYRLQKSLSAQVPEIIRFNSRLARLENRPDLSWHELCDRADAMLKPTLRLGTEISHAYSELL